MVRVHAPRLEFVSDEERERYLPPEPAEPRDFGTHLAKLCAEIGCDFVDLYAVFQRAAEIDPKGIYIPSDEHLDERGHELVTAEVVRWLTRKR